MLPLHISAHEDRTRPSLMTSRSLREYLGMAVQYAHLDVDYTFAQMCYLCIAPKKVYQLTCYRKQTKNRWSRDDPAFVVISIMFLFVASVAYSLTFRANLLRVLIWTVGLHYLLMGLLLATAFTYVCNNYLRMRAPMHTGLFVRQTLEWQYAWDIHCNSFVLVIAIVYVAQFLLLPVLYDDCGVASALNEARRKQEEAIASVITMNGTRPNRVGGANVGPESSHFSNTLAPRRVLSNDIGFSSSTAAAAALVGLKTEEVSGGVAIHSLRRILLDSGTTVISNHATHSRQAAGVSHAAPPLADFFDPSLLASPSLLRCFLSNLLFALSLVAYFYVSSMGYAVLPFLEKTETLLYPCIALLLAIVASIFLRINLTVWFVYMIC